MQSRPRAGATETLAEPKAKRVLLEALRGRGGKLTKADAVTLSGLPEPQAERALSVLLKEYRSHLCATESGELVYQFDPAFQRRGALTWRERLASVGAVLWTGFTFLFKVSIVVTLVVYFALFVAMLLALIVARRSDDDDDRGFGFGIGDLFWIWGWNPGFAVGRANRSTRACSTSCSGRRAPGRTRWATRRRSWRRFGRARDASARSTWSSSWAGTSSAPRRR